MESESPKNLPDGSIERTVCSSNGGDNLFFLNGREALSEQEHPTPSAEGAHSVSPGMQMQRVSNDVSNGEAHAGPVSNDVSNLSNGDAGTEQSSIIPTPRAWRTPEPKAALTPDAEFIMEASSWPTLAEARHAKPSEARVSPSQAETIPVSSPAQKENSIEAPKHTNANPPSRYRSSNRKGSYGKPMFPATENIPVPPMGAHVPSANMFNVDQSRKRNGVVGMNNFFPGVSPFPHHRGEGLAPFPQNSVMPPYARGPPGWHHYGGGYRDANFNYPGFVPRYEHQFIDPRSMHPPIAPWQQHHYPNFPGNMSLYMPATFSPGQNYNAPYYGPSGPPEGLMQGHDFPTLLVMLQRQIEYYFSKENLIRDIYLTSKMDEEGFVPVSLIASFPRVKNLTSNSMHILEALKNSSIVEVKNGKFRSREWRRQSSLVASSSKTGVNCAGEQRNSESLAQSSSSGVDHAREQRSREPKEFEEGGFDKMGTSIESKLIAESCAATWTGLSSNLGTINVPAVTSIDLR